MSRRALDLERDVVGEGRGRGQGAGGIAEGEDPGEADLAEQAAGLLEVLVRLARESRR